MPTDPTDFGGPAYVGLGPSWQLVTFLIRTPLWQFSEQVMRRSQSLQSIREPAENSAKAASCTRSGLITMHRNHLAFRGEDYQTELGASHLMIRTDLGAVRLQNL